MNDLVPVTSSGAGGAREGPLDGGGSFRKAVQPATKHVREKVELDPRCKRR
jgi:hypothetical protein